MSCEIVLAFTFGVFIALFFLVAQIDNLVFVSKDNYVKYKNYMYKITKVEE